MNFVDFQIILKQLFIVFIDYSGQIIKTLKYIIIYNIILK